VCYKDFFNAFAFTKKKIKNARSALWAKLQKKKNSKTNLCDIEAIHCLIINNFCVLTQYVRITFSELCEV